MNLVAAIILTILNLGALGLTALTLPGNWIILTLTSLAAVWRREDDFIGLPILIIIAALALTGEILETASSALTVKKAGGSRKGSLGGIAGSIAGAIIGGILIPIPVIGSLLGACGGALLGTAVVERTQGETVSTAVKRGKASFTGRLTGTLLKLVAGTVMWIITAFSAFL